MSDGVKKTPSRTIRSPRRQKTTANLGAAEFPQGGFADRGCPIKGIPMKQKNQIEAQRSGFDLERRSDGVNERWR